MKHKAPTTTIEEPVVFFVHLMKTGGTTVNLNLLGKYPGGCRYPEEGVDAMTMEAKSLTRNLFALSEERRASLRWISPHLPLSAATRFREEMERPVSITMLLRDGLDRSVSYLRNLSLRFNHAYTYRELLDIPLLRKFFLSNHQTRALSITEANWQEWDNSMRGLFLLSLGVDKAQPISEISPVGEVDLNIAIAALSQVDVLGLQNEFDDWWQRCRQAYQWPGTPKYSANVTPAGDFGKVPPVPDSIIEELRELNALDSRLYAGASEILRSR